MSFKASIEMTTHTAPRLGGINTTGDDTVSTARVEIEGREPAEFKGRGEAQALGAALDYIRVTARAVPLHSEDEED